MFKKFTQSDISSQTAVKTSIARKVIRPQLLRVLTIEDEKLEEIWPKKEQLTLVKCKDNISVYSLNGEPLFFQQYDEQLYPTLRLVHKYPTILPRVQIDRGAIRHLLAGANMMCRGLTSAGGYLPPSDSPLPEGRAVAIFCEGKIHAAGIGFLRMDTEKIKAVNKDIGVEVKTYLGDGLWSLERTGKSF